MAFFLYLCWLTSMKGDHPKKLGSATTVAPAPITAATSPRNPANPAPASTPYRAPTVADVNALLDRQAQTNAEDARQENGQPALLDQVHGAAAAQAAAAETPAPRVNYGTPYTEVEPATSNGNGALRDRSVSGYTRGDGTQVPGYYRR